MTGPADGLRIATGLSFVAEFPGALANLEEGAGDVVPFTQVRVFFERGDGSIALNQTYPFGAGVDTLALALNIPLSPDAPVEGELLSLYLRYMNATGDTVFSGGPVEVLAVPRRRGDPLPPPAQVTLEYTGPGAEAATVQLSPDTLSIVAGDGFAFNAFVRDGQGALVSGAPIIFSSLDADKITLLGPAAPGGTSLATRGVARMRAVLAATGAADTAVVIIAPKPASLARVGATALAGFTNSVLADSVIVRLLATDGDPIANASVNVVVEGGGSVNSSTLSTDADGRAAVQWTLGATVGVAAQRLKFNSTGVSELSVTATVTAPTLVASQLVITQQPPASAVSNVPFAPPLTVEARNSNNELVPTFSGNVSVIQVSAPVNGSLVGTFTTTAVNGVATFSSMAATLVGSYRIGVTSGTLIPDTTDAFIVVPGAPTNIAPLNGGGQTALVGSLLPSEISVVVGDLAGNRVPNAEVAFSVTSGGGSLIGAAAISDSLGIARLGGWILGPIAGTQTITATVTGADPLQITATAQPLAPVIALSVVGSNVVGFQRDGDLFVRLLQPAPVGGLTVSVVSDSTAYLTIAAPGSVSIAAGDTAAIIGVTGVNVGTAVVRATAPGYTSDTLAVPVSLNLISLPTTLNVSLNGTVSMPVQISTPAPAGGVWVKLVSAEPTTARTTTDSVLIASGTTTANATLQGLAIGTTTITASNPNFAPDVSTVSVTAGIDIVAASITFNRSFGSTMVVRLVSGGSAVAAPAGGIVVNLSADNSSCVSLPSSAVIGAGLTNVTVSLTAGVGSTFPCSTFVRASGPLGFTADSATTNVGVTPGITGNNRILGAGLQSDGSFSLGASNHGGTTVRITSLEPDRLLISPNQTTVGSAFVDVPVGISFTSGAFVYQALETVNEDTVAVTVSAPGFVTDTITMVITQPVHSITNILASRTTGSADDVFTIRIGTPSSPTNQFISSFDDIRFGSAARVFTVINDSIARGALVTTAVVSDTVTVTIPVGSSTTAASVALGGVAFRSGQAGVTVVRVTSPLSRAGTQASATITTVQSSILSVGGITGTVGIGRGLMRFGDVRISEALAVGDSVPITVRVSRPGFAILSNNNNAAGTSDTVVTVVPSGSSVAALSIQILETAPLDTFSLIVSAPGYTGLTVQSEVVQPLIRIFNDLLATGTVGDPDDLFRLETGSPDPFGTQLGAQDPPRLGGPGMLVNIINDSTQFGTLVYSGGTADSLSVLIPPGIRASGGTLAAGGVAFRYLAPGVAVLRANAPGALAIPGATKTVTISQPSITALTPMGIGAGLQRNGSITLNTPAPAGGLPVLLRADTPNTVKFAPNNLTAGSDSLVITVTAGTSSANFTLQVLEVPQDTITITASSAGWAPRNATITIFQPIIEYATFPSNQTTLSPDATITVRVGSPTTPTAPNISIIDARRIGAPPLPVTVASSNGFVGRLVTSSTVSDTVVVNILPGASTSANTLPSGGIAFRSLTSGTTTISATAPGVRQSPAAVGTPVSIATPGISVSVGSNVGAGLHTTGSLLLGATQHGGIQLVLKSSNPNIAKVARFATDVATDSIIVNVANGLGSIPFLVAGIEDTTGQVTITARATGFTDGNALATVVRPAVDFVSVPTPLVAGAADAQFRVRVGLPNGQLSGLSLTQEVRTGSAGITVTVTSSNTAVGTLVTSALTGSPVTVVITAGNVASPTLINSGGVGLRPLAPGLTTVTASAPGFTTMTTSGIINVTVNSP